VILTSINIQAQQDKWDYFDPYWRNISTIAQDGDYLWIGKSMGGAVQFNMITEEMEDYKRYFTPLTSNTITKIIIDKQGNKWFGMGSNSNTNKMGIAKYDDQNWELFDSDNSPLPEGYLNYFDVDGLGNLWVGTAGDGLLKYDGITWTKYDTTNSGIPFNSVRSVAIDSSNNVWFVSSDLAFYKTLVKFDGLGWTIHQPDSNGLPSAGYWELKIDNQDNKWMSVYGMLLKYDNSIFTSYNPNLSGIQIGFILTIDLDDNGNCYIGTADTGLVKLDTAGNWSVYMISPDRNLNYVNRVFIDDNNIKWLATYKGLTKFDEIEIESYKMSNAPLIDHRMSDVYIEDDGTIWFGAFSIVKKDGDIWRRFDYTNSSFPVSNINRFEMDSENNLWAGTLDGLVKLKDTTITLYTTGNTNLPSNWITDITKDRNNILWITTGNGIVRMENDSMIIFDENNTPLVDDQMLTVEVDRLNNKWFGGYTCGLVKFDDVNWTIFNTSNSGLWSNEIRDLAIDKNNNIIIANGELQKFTGNSWYTVNLPDTLNYQIEVEADSIGNIWTSTYQRGIVKIDPWNNWTVFNNQNSGLIGDNQMVHSTRIDKNGYKYFCTNDGGVTIYKGDLVLGVENNPDGTIVSDFKLFQNYPNPFNPSTTISYQLPVSGKVKLVIFDVLGKEIATLVNEEKTAGSYEVEFGSLVGSLHFASGIYFYQLKASDFVETKKMILLK